MTTCEQVRVGQRPIMPAAHPHRQKPERLVAASMMTCEQVREQED